MRSGKLGCVASKRMKHAKRSDICVDRCTYGHTNQGAGRGDGGGRPLGLSRGLPPTPPTSHPPQCPQLNP
eukprot:scaffold647429_cov22-Prasinocladus_malaysianus.AAC.1